MCTCIRTASARPPHFRRPYARRSLAATPGPAGCDRGPSHGEVFYSGGN